MAPKRAKQTTDTGDKDDSDKQPTWDSSLRNLRLYLLPLKRWLPRQHAQLNNFVRYGYIMNNKQEILVYNSDHQEQLQHNKLVPGSFEKPWILRD